MGFTVLFAILYISNQYALASEQQDIEMKKLSAASGCNLCHALEHRKYGKDELLPIAPAWEDVAKKYKGQKYAVERLVRIVLQGSGSSDRHWSGKARGVAMLPNAVEISEPNAEKLVRWILSLDKTANR